MIGMRPRLATRIALLIIVPTIVIQFVNAGLFFLLPKPTIHLYRSEWVLSASQRIARKVFEAPPGERQAILAAAPERQWLDLTWQSIAPDGIESGIEIPELRRLERQLLADLGPLVKSVSVVSLRRRGMDPAGAHIQIIPPDEAMPADVSDHAIEYRSSIPDLFGLAIGGNDGTWLSIMPKREHHELMRLLSVIGGLVVTGAVIAALSMLAARRVMKRMNRMAAAAERLGREREMTVISEAGLGEFTQVARSLNEMQARLKRFVDERTRMVAAISHDLRTPLTRMKLTAEYISDVEVKREITDGLDRMRAMIEATLNFASHDARGEAHQKIDIASLIISLVDEICDQGHDLRYEGPDHCLLSCQPQMMRRALANLLDNAVKYAPSASVTLEAGAKGLMIQISDDGPGIPTHQLDVALEPFFRVETSRNEETGGFGLGLSIANDIILAHGGEMRLSNRLPHGLLVEITLPTDPASA